MNRFKPLEYIFHYPAEKLEAALGGAVPWSWMHAIWYLVLFLLPSAAVYAQLDKDEQVCVNALNRNLQKVSSARGKAPGPCSRLR